MPRTHNIAKICERYGGGGHAVVGAISFGPEEVEEARHAVEIVAKLLCGTQSQNNADLKTHLFESERLDRIQPRGLPSGPQSEPNA